MIEPFGSSVLSLSVPTVRVAVLSVMATLREPVWPLAAKSPLSVTVTFTVMLPAGAGFAVSVKVASPPSVTAPPPEMLTTGRAGGSSCRTKMSLAMRALVKGLTPLMLVMVPCGEVFGLLSEKPFPSSVPAS